MAAQKAPGDFSSRYKFNGKELDEETGLYYYGARYYDPKVSLWLSVDPLAEKYPGMSPYVYTAGHPVRFIDPNGMFCYDPEGNMTACPESLKKYEGPSVMSAIIYNGELMVDFYTGERSISDMVQKLNEVNINLENINYVSTALSIAEYEGGLLMEKTDKFIINELLFNYYNPKTNLCSVTLSVEEGTNLANSYSKLYTVKITGKYLSKLGTVASYVGPSLEFFRGEYYNGTVEFASASVALYLTKTRGNMYGLAWTIGWELGRLLTSTEWYYRNVFGTYSDAYIKAAIKNHWDVQLDYWQINRAYYLITTGEW